MNHNFKLKNLICFLPLLLVVGCISGDGNTFNFSVGDINPTKTFGVVVLIYYLASRRKRKTPTSDHRNSI